MTLTLLGNYAQTGHFGGPTAYTPFNVATHLAGPASGGLRFDYRRQKHPYSDKFMLAAGHCAPTCYALWMIMGEAMYRKHQATGDRRYHVAPDAAMLSVDALGFRRGAGALKTLLVRSGARGSPAVRPGQGSRHPLPVRAHRVDRRDERRQRRAVGHRHRHRRGQGRVLGLHRRAAGIAQGHRLRGRVRDVRRPRPGAEDAGHRAPGRQAAPHLLLRQQRRHRRRADRRRGESEVRRLPPDRPVDILRLERVLHPRRSRLRPDRPGAARDGGVGPARPPADDRVRQDDQGILARRGERASCTARTRSSGIRAIPTPSR